MIVNLPNAKLSPQTVLAQVAEGDHKAVAIVYLDKDDKAFACWSNMDTATLAFLSMTLQIRTTDEMRRVDD